MCLSLFLKESDILYAYKLNVEQLFVSVRGTDGGEDI